MVRYVPNELAPYFLGVAALNPFVRNDSSSRLAMFCSQIGQPLTLENGDVDRLSTGVSRCFAGDVHDIRFPTNAKIKAVLPKYPSSTGINRRIENTQTAIIYIDDMSATQEYGVLVKEKFHSLHQHFGFNYVDVAKNMRRLSPGEAFAKDTVIATSPSVTEDGDIRLGVEVQTALVTHQSVIEDGIVVSDWLCREKLRTKGYGVRTASWGESGIPLNMYGNPDDPKDYKIHPDIGEYVKDNGILFSTRKMDDRIAVSTMSRKALRNVDFFDRTIYAIPNAKVIDVIVYKGNKDRSYMPAGTDRQCNFYYNKTLSYYKSIVDFYNKIRREHGENLRLSPELTNLIKTAIAYIEVPNRKHITPTMNLQNMDEWVVDIIFEYDIIPTIGFKLTGYDGDKGVICDVWPRHKMPVDCSGNIADALMDPDSTFKRMNIGRIYRQYICAVCRITGIKVKAMLEEAKGAKDKINEIFDYVCGLYKIVSPPMYSKVLRVITTYADKVRHLTYVAKDGVYLYMPTDNPRIYYEVIAALAEQYPAPYGPVTFIGYKGNTITTKKPVLIGGLYMLLLEKTGNLWSSVASPKLQHFGTPGKMSNSDKFTNPGRVSSTRGIGEAEARNYVALCGPKVVADLIDQSNSPTVHRVVCEGILEAEFPSDIKVLVDRKKYPRGLGRIHSLISHSLECGGVRLRRDIIQ